MITDKDTNFLFLSELLKKPEYSAAYSDLAKGLSSANIPFRFLQGTKDIWAKDYMPIQLDDHKFIQFNFDPDYLKAKKYHHFRTEPSQVMLDIELSITKSFIKLDGGNVIKGDGWVIMTEKIFSENNHIANLKLIQDLELLFNSRIIIIPKYPGDYTGHADGIVRYYSGKKVLISRYFNKDELKFKAKLINKLKISGLEPIEIPYNPYQNDDKEDATGLYINFLQMNNHIFLPVFDLPEDEQALSLFEELFSGYSIIPVKSNSIAKEGGILNCISWNIKI